MKDAEGKSLGQPNKPVWGEGPDDPDGILVGESPGREEAARGRPFIGPTGQQLNDELLAVGLRRSRLFVLNAVLCPPPMGLAKKTLKDAVKCCEKAFEWQLRSFPQDIPFFAMGEAACLAILQRPLPKGGVGKARGFVRDLQLPRKYTSKDKEIWQEPTPQETVPPKINSKPSTKPVSSKPKPKR